MARMGKSGIRSARRKRRGSVIGSCPRATGMQVRLSSQRNCQAGKPDLLIVQGFAAAARERDYPCNDAAGPIAYRSNIFREVNHFRRERSWRNALSTAENSAINTMRRRAATRSPKPKRPKKPRVKRTRKRRKRAKRRKARKPREMPRRERKATRMA